MLADLSAITLAPLQRVLQAAARLVNGLHHHDHVKETFKELDWLLIVQWIEKKLCLLVCLSHKSATYWYTLVDCRLPSLMSALFDATEGIKLRRAENTPSISKLTMQRDNVRICFRLTRLFIKLVLYTGD